MTAYSAYSSNAALPSYYRAHVVNVVDGDTIDCDVNLQFHITMRLRFRILGINAPEMHGPSHDQGLAAKEYAKKLIGEGDVILRTGEKTDDFGRWLAEVTLSDSRSFGEEMMKAGHAVPFDPRAKLGMEIPG